MTQIKETGEKKENRNVAKKKKKRHTTKIETVGRRQLSPTTND